jgi:hypothetical protein
MESFVISLGQVRFGFESDERIICHISFDIFQLSFGFDTTGFIPVVIQIHANTRYLRSWRGEAAKTPKARD